MKKIGHILSGRLLSHKNCFFFRPSIGDSCVTSESSCITTKSYTAVSVSCNSDSKASTVMEC